MFIYERQSIHGDALTVKFASCFRLLYTACAHPLLLSRSQVVSILFLFVDGVGLAPEDLDNPPADAPTPAIRSMLKRCTHHRGCRRFVQYIAAPIRCGDGGHRLAAERRRADGIADQRERGGDSWSSSTTMFCLWRCDDCWWNAASFDVLPRAEGGLRSPVHLVCVTGRCWRRDACDTLPV